MREESALLYAAIFTESAIVQSSHISLAAAAGLFVPTSCFTPVYPSTSS